MTDETGARGEALALELLARAVPANVREVCRVLEKAGFEAVTVGGAVRDAILGRHPKDWDVATSAHPPEVVKLFRHTVGTGLAHGTVTIVTGKGEESHVEVTTFRGEGAYSDSRRPDHVVFGVPLIEDLARRDLTVNAIAYDPAKRVLIDPFDGREDLAHRRLRAVGTAVDRFTEDGLRVMRAVRFAAQLEFVLDPETEAAIVPALPSLEKVSRERVCIELRKTLATRQPSLGLSPSYRTRIIASILPALNARLGDDAAVAEWLGRIDRAAHGVRLAAMLAPLADAPDPYVLDRRVSGQVTDLLKDLKFSNLEIKLASQLVAVARASRGEEWTATRVRLLLAKLDRDARTHAVELWTAEPSPNDLLIAHAQKILAEKHPLAIGDLAITGGDLMKDLAMPAGPAIGRVLSQLLLRVIDDPALNTREDLLAAAQKIELELGR